MKPTPYLFVYGTLKRGSKVPQRQVLEDSGHFIKDGVLQGRLFHLDAYPAAVLSEDSRDLVHGEVYELKDPEENLKGLDDYEGGEYERVLAPVIFQDYGFPLECWVYLYRGKTAGLAPVPGGRFLL